MRRILCWLFGCTFELGEWVLANYSGFYPDGEWVGEPGIPCLRCGRRAKRIPGYHYRRAVYPLEHWPDDEPLTQDVIAKRYLEKP